ncbi:MAG: TOBE domain-containing protein, partial [Candidatus Devosia euplotis]|nr:TOBE domain-containing protein [Candidatus Devosia euplotis]
GSPSMNFFQGALDGSKFVCDDGTEISTASYEFAVPVAAKTKAVLGVRPEHIILGDDARSMPFTTEVEIEIVEPMGSDTLAWTKIAGHQVTFRCNSDVVLKTGRKVVVGFDTGRGSIFSTETTDLL